MHACQALCVCVLPPTNRSTWAEVWMAECIHTKDEQLILERQGAPEHSADHGQCREAASEGTLSDINRNTPADGEGGQQSESRVPPSR
jgi:hypothetical protein